MQNGGDTRAARSAVGLESPAGQTPSSWPSAASAERRQSAAGSVDSRAVVRTYRRRWYVLLIFSSLSCVQCAVWNTFGPITEAVQAAFPSWDNSDISMLSNIGNMAFLAFVAPFCWLLSRFGLRWAVLLMAFCIALGTALRSVSSEEKTFTAMAYVCGGVNGAAGVMAMAAPAYVSALWFPPQQRATATTVSSVAIQLGAAVSYVLGPTVVRLPGGANPNTDPDAARYYIMLLMDVETGVAAVLFLAVILYFPSRPPHPPSASAALPPPPGSFWRQVRVAARSPDLPWLVLAYSLPLGIQVAYFAVLDISMSPLGVTQEQAGWLGFWAMLGSCCAALLLARITDMFSGHLRTTLMLLQLSGALCFFWLLALVAGWQTLNMPSLYAATLLGLACTYSTSPLMYEYTAELLYPVSADVIGAVLSVSITIAGIIPLLLFLVPTLSENTLWMNVTLVCALPVGMGLLLKTNEVYRRTQLDRAPAEGNSGAPGNSGEAGNSGGVDGTGNGEELKSETVATSSREGCVLVAVIELREFADESTDT